MNQNSRNHQGGGDSHAPHNSQNDSLLKSLEPSLWNSPLGRRAFLKKTGAATVGMAVLLHGFRSELLASESGEDEWPTLPDYRTVVFGIKMIAPPGGFANQADAQAALDLMELDWTQEQCPVPTDEDPPMPPNFVPTPPPPANQLAPIDIPGIAPDPLLNLKQLSDTGVVNQTFRNPIWMGTTTITFDAHVVQIPGSTKFGVEGVITVHFNYYDGEVPSFPEGTDPGSAV